MPTLTVRPYADDADLDTILALVNAAAIADDEDTMTRTELGTLLTDSWLDAANDMRLWFDDDNQLIAYATLLLPEAPDEIDGRLYYSVEPAARNAELDEMVIEWAEGRLHEYRVQRQLPTWLRISVKQGNVQRAALLERNGFAIERYFFEMSRSLDSVPEPQFPNGFRVREVAGESDADAWVALKNATWVDHFNYRPWSVDRFKVWLQDPDERPELNLVAVAPDGALAAFCWSLIRPEENVQPEHSKGAIDLVGTHPAYRKLGLGRAMLLTALQRLKTAGIHTAKLDVDAASPTGATRLYEGVGFTVARTFMSYTKQVVDA